MDSRAGSERNSSELDRVSKFRCCTFLYYILYCDLSYHADAQQGPVTEEIIFRSVIISFHVLARISPERIVAVSPLYFGIAHGHHFYEFRITHPETPVSAALFRSIFQFGYTTVFGWLAAFLYLRTGSLPAVILVHSFCNWCGLPRLWGRLDADVVAGPPLLRDKEDFSRTTIREVSGRSGIKWTVAYYVILVCGAIGFFYLLWPLTKSPHALAEFSQDSSETTILSFR